MLKSLFSRRHLLQGSAAVAGAAGLGLAQGRALAAAGGLTRGAAEAAMSQESDLTLVNGKILTLDGKNTVVSSLAIRRGRVAEVGKSVGTAGRIIDLKGATVIPGLIDAHAHLYFCLTNNPGYEARDIELARTLPQLLKAISDRARTVPAGQFITCNGGWNRRGLAEKRVPTAAELDAAAPNHPVWIVEMQSENSWIDPKKYPPLPGIANTRGLAFFGKHGVTGDAKTGAVPWSESMQVLVAAQTEADRRRSVSDCIDFMAGHGLTMIHNMGGVGGEESLEAGYPYVIDLWRQQKLNLRFRLRLGARGVEGAKALVLNNINRLGDDVLRLNGFGEGIWEGDPKEFVEAGTVLASHGWSNHEHSVTVAAPGDLTEHKAHVAGFRAIDAVNSLKDLRWSLAHGNYLTPELTQALEAMGVGVEGDAWQYTEALAPVPMGPPFRMLLDSGIHLGGGSDCAGAEGANPWLTIAWMTTGRLNTGELGNPGQTISRMEALKVHSLGSAWHSFDDHHLGSLEVGKLADLAVLSDDALTVSDDNLRKITSTLTLQAGRTVYQKS